jgi:twitching motility protein PilT
VTSDAAPTIDTRLYPVAPDRALSMRDLLEYFAKHGSLRVSDLHLKVGSPPIYRIDGSLQKIKGAPMAAATIQGLAHTLLTDTKWAVLERERSVDSSYVLGNTQFRLNFFHDNEGLAIAVRALESKPLPVEHIGFPNAVWHDIVNRGHGLVLITGITGAGKSTTVASLIDRIAETMPCRIITLEDPVEYRLSSKTALISQREVGRDVPTFERGLRDCLREDPDVIFVGEMRDRESAAWTLTAAETGHLVFSTLHTRDAPGSMTRLLDMFPANQQDEVSSQLSLGLAYILSQKLVPRADGQGRVVAMEILNNNYAVSNLIRVRKLEQIYSQLQSRTRDVPEERMCTLERSLAELVHAGKITAEDATRWCNDPRSLLGELQRKD